MSGRPRRSLIADPTLLEHLRRSPRISAKETAERLASITEKSPAKKRVPTPPRAKNNNVMAHNDSRAYYPPDPFSDIEDDDRPNQLGGRADSTGARLRRVFASFKSWPGDKVGKHVNKDDNTWSKADLFSIIVVCPAILAAILALFLWPAPEILPDLPGKLAENADRAYTRLLAGLEVARIRERPPEVDLDVLLDRILANDKFNELVTAGTINDGQASAELKLQIYDMKKAQAKVRDDLADRLTDFGRRVEQLNMEEAGVKSQVQKLELENAALVARIEQLLREQQRLAEAVRAGCKERAVEAPVSRDELGVRIRQEMSRLVSPERQMSRSDVFEVVHEALNVYDADKTGLFDFALESAGGTIESTRCTETYDASQAVYSLWGLPVWWSRQTARTILNPDTSPGRCWAFKGSQGSVVIRLSRPVHVESVTLEHIPLMLSPDGNVSSAPRKFTVLGLESVEDPNPYILGNFTYSSDEPVKTYAVASEPGRPLDLVELKVLSNHGNPDYTCVYRFRVHGRTTPHKP